MLGLLLCSMELQSTVLVFSNAQWSSNHGRDFSINEVCKLLKCADLGFSKGLSGFLDEWNAILVFLIITFVPEKKEERNKENAKEEKKEEEKNGVKQGRASGESTQS